MEKVFQPSAECKGKEKQCQSEADTGFGQAEFPESAVIVLIIKSSIMLNDNLFIKVYHTKLSRLNQSNKQSAIQNPQPVKSILIIGTGSIGERHLRCFLATGRARVSFCEPNPELRMRIGEQYPSRGFESLDRALNEQAFDGAVICTPAHTHLSIAHQLLDRRIAVLLEKPLSTVYDEVPAFLKRIESENHIARVAYVYRSFPLIQELHRLLQEAPFGAPRHIVVVSGQNFPSFRPAYRDIYYNNHATGGGAIQDALTHGIHAVEWLDGAICEVSCHAEHQVLEGVEVEDTVNLIAKNRNGTLINFSLNQFQAPNESFWFIHCPGGSFRAEIHNQRIGKLAFGESEWQWQDIPREERDAAFTRQAQAFLDNLDGSPSPLATVAEAAQTLKVHLAALKSSQTGQTVKNLA